MIAILIYIHLHDLRLQIVLYTNNRVPRRGRVGPAYDCTGCGLCSLSNSSGSSTSRFSLGKFLVVVIIVSLVHVNVFGGCTIGTQSRAKQPSLFTTTGLFSVADLFGIYRQQTGSGTESGWIGWARNHWKPFYSQPVQAYVDGQTPSGPEDRP